MVFMLWARSRPLCGNGGPVCEHACPGRLRSRIVHLVAMSRPRTAPLRSLNIYLAP